MSANDSSPSAADLMHIIDSAQQANISAVAATLTISRQAAASCLVHALIIRELNIAGLIDREALQAEAIERAQPLGPEVVSVIESVFGGKIPLMPDIPARKSLTLIHGGLADAT